MELLKYHHAMVIHIWHNFHENPFISYKGTNLLTLRQSKSKNSCMPNDILMKHHVHHPTSYSVKFNEKQSISYRFTKMYAIKGH